MHQLAITAPNVQPSKRSARLQNIENFLNDYYDLRYNNITHQVEFRTKETCPFSPVNENTIYRTMSLHGIKTSIHEIRILLGSDFVPEYNPITDYFKTIQYIWSDKKFGDCIAQLASYVHVKNAERFSIQLKKWMVRCVACAHLPDYYNKTALILVGELQNTGKSSFIRYLCPPKLSGYMTENISTDKDSLIAICENFLINLDELSTLSKIEINALKSIFSKDRVKVRLPFERRATTLNRVASFIGSTNKAQFLTDETGSVRFLTFEVDAIDWAYSERINIDIAWSQAYKLWINDFNAELTMDEYKENELINNSYKVVTPELDLVLRFLKPGTKEHHQQFCTTTEIAEYLTASTDRRIPINAINLGRALKTAGFTREQRSGHQDQVFPVKGYYLFHKSSY